MTHTHTQSHWLPTQNVRVNGKEKEVKQQNKKKEKNLLPYGDLLYNSTLL